MGLNKMVIQYEDGREIEGDINGKLTEIINETVKSIRLYCDNGNIDIIKIDGVFKRKTNSLTN